MPIKDIQRQAYLSRLGVIRLGVKQVSKSGNEYPIETDYFVLRDAPGLAPMYGEMPHELLIYLPFATVDENFPSYHELWRGGVCHCRGDGQRIIDYLHNGQRAIHNGLAIVDHNSSRAGDVIACPGLQHDLYERCSACKPSGMLLVMVRDPSRPDQLINDRLGYYQLRTHSLYNIRSLTGQLLYAADLAARMDRDLRGIPMILKRVPRQISYTAEDGTRKTIEKHMLDLEFDLKWVQLANKAMHDMALAGLEMATLPATIVVDEDTGEIIDHEPEPAPEHEPVHDKPHGDNPDDHIRADVESYVDSCLAVEMRQLSREMLAVLIQHGWWLVGCSHPEHFANRFKKRFPGTRGDYRLVPGKLGMFLERMRESD
jgi:hypothetical protein